MFLLFLNQMVEAKTKNEKTICYPFSDSEDGSQSPAKKKCLEKQKSEKIDEQQRLKREKQEEERTKMQ